MNNSAPKWIVVASENGARLLRHTCVTQRPHIDEIERFDNRWQAPPEEPPMSLSSPKNEHSYGSHRHVAEEHERRYATHLAEWIEGIIEGRELDEIFVFASPRLHGWLQRAYAPRTIRSIRSKTGDFAKAAAGELADHPAFLNLVA